MGIGFLCAEGRARSPFLLRPSVPTPDFGSGFDRVVCPVPCLRPLRPTEKETVGRFSCASVPGYVQPLGLLSATSMLRSSLVTRKFDYVTTCGEGLPGPGQGDGEALQWLAVEGRGPGFTPKRENGALSTVLGGRLRLKAIFTTKASFGRFNGDEPGIRSLSTRDLSV